MTTRWTTAALLTPAALLLILTVGLGGALAAPPEIQDVVIDRGRDANWWDWSMWHTRYVVQVQGSADEQPAQLWLEDMQGCRQVILTDGSHWYDPAGTNPGGSWEDARVTAGPDYTYTYVWYEARQANPIPDGSYTITVIGTAGSQTSLTTANLPAVPDAVPTLIAPTDQGVTETTAPTFQWLPISGTEGTLQVRAEGDTNYTGPAPDLDDCGQIWRVPISPSGPSTAVYNFDGQGPALDPGRAYFWQINDWIPVDDRMSDPRVSVWDSQTSRHRFTVDTTWPSLPVLPGKLAYEHTLYGDDSDPYNLQAILQYGTTPAQRTWVGPDGSHTPSYSWDGTKIAYRVSDWGIRVANADGSDSVRLFGNWAWNNADLSPDATSVTYSDGEWQGSSPQHVFIQKLFEPTRTLVVRARGERAWQPRWSPDGQWIAYLSIGDPTGYSTWLVHPDGTDDHPVVPTGVVGYAGATITEAEGTVWSPDAKFLGVNFFATPSEGPEISGIGVIPREGGEITPIWLNPMGFVCCASAFFGTWSPDGESIVFSSAHHLPFDPDWEFGKFEPGVELWMIDADGAGPPTRLTYDYSHSSEVAWWAPNMPDGSDVAITKGDATITFADVAVGGSASVCVVPDGPGPAPEGYELVGDCWTLLIDGLASGVTVELAYADAGVAPELEPDLCLLAWIDGQWRDVTTDLDTGQEIIAGHATALSYFTLGFGQRFGDVDNTHWALGAINACVNAGIVGGYPDGLYHPDWPVTRDQMAVYIARALADGEDNVPPGPADATFDDVPVGYWAYDAVEYCYDQNVVQGYDPTTYAPTEQVTRDQMAAYVARALVAPSGQVIIDDYVPTDPRNFPDVDSGFWAYKHIEYCVEHGVVQGYDDGYYHPDYVVTRDQMAVYVARAFGLLD